MELLGVIRFLKNQLDIKNRFDVLNLAIAKEVFYEVDTEEMQGLRAPEGHGYHSSLECQGLNRYAKQIDVK